MTGDRHAYRTSAAFRNALEDRLRRQAHDSGVPLDRLRKEVAHQRLLARLVVAAPPGSWALKGGQALLARLDAAARSTKDADATWRGSLGEFTDVLEDATETDLGDGFSFEVSAPRPLTAETHDGGLRFPVLALLDGREFERLQLDINGLPGDDRPLEQLVLRDLLGFAAISTPTVPVISVAQHLAEKLHAYARDYGGERSTRPRDLYDMLVIARSLPLPHLHVLHAACRTTFELRQTDWPPALLSPPSTWATAWSALVRDHDIPWNDLTYAGDALTALWEPALTTQRPSDATWSAQRWRWLTA